MPVWLERNDPYVKAGRYFAELSADWFGDSDFFPHNGEQLLAFDPESYAVTAAAWGEPRPMR